MVVAVNERQLSGGRRRRRAPVQRGEPRARDRRLDGLKPRRIVGMIGDKARGSCCSEEGWWK